MTRIAFSISVSTTRRMPAANASTLGNSPFCSRISLSARSDEEARCRPGNWRHRAVQATRLASVTVAMGSATETDRPWIGTRRFRTDPQHTALIESGHRSAARSGRMDLEHRHAHRHSCYNRFPVRRTPPRVASERNTSVEVPPISSPMMRSKPAHAATREAPITPPAGPERTVRTGSWAATRAETMPPEDCITSTRPS